MYFSISQPICEGKIAVSRAAEGELMQPEQLTKAMSCTVSREVGCPPPSRETENCLWRSASLGLVTAVGSAL